MKVPFFIIGFALTVAPAVAATITPGQATSNQGSNVIVEGAATVRPAMAPHDGMEVALGTGTSVLLAYIPKQNVDKFPDLASLNGQVVDVSGVVEMDEGKPEIRVTSPSQLNIVR